MAYRIVFVRVGIIISVITAMLMPAAVHAASQPQLVVSQLKITSSNGQFVTLYNQSATAIDLSQFEIDYINSTGKLASLGVSGTVPAHGFYQLSDDQQRICYQMTVNATSLGFATTSGSLQVWQLSGDKTSKTLQDSVTWASKATTGAITLPAQNTSNTVSLLRQPMDSSGNPQITTAAGGSWQAVAPDSTVPCTLDIINTVTAVSSPSQNPGNQLGTGQMAPSTIITLAANDDSGTPAATLPVADIGLNAPQITELLPNPDGTGNDATDEFIELYNPNLSPFHLLGFTLQTGTTTKHSYVFPDGTILAPGSFTAFYSGDTGLSLSNTSGQADLLDPFGNTISQTDAYDTAKDGQTWAVANGKWYWTTQATPGAANVIKQIVLASKTKAKGASKSAASQSKAAVKGASTSSAKSNLPTTNAADTTTPAPIHPIILVAVAVLAVGYGVYEYRHDLANRIHQFRSNRAARRKARA